MADRTLTVNGQPFTFNRDRFAGVRTMTSGHVYPTIASGSFNATGVTFQKLPIGNADEKTFTLVANNSTATRYVSFVTGSNGIRAGKHRIAFDLTLNSGSLGTITGFYTDQDADPSNGASYGSYSLTEGSNVIDFEIFDDGVGASPEIIWAINTGSTFDISVTNLKVTHNYEEITVDRTADSGGRTMTSGHVYPSSQFTASSTTSYWSATATAGTEGTEWRLISTLGNDGAFNFGTLMLADNTTASKVRVGKHRVEFDLTLNSGDINEDSSVGNDGFLLIARDPDADPSGSAISTARTISVGSNIIDVEVFDDGDDTFEPNIFLSARPDSVFDITISNLKVTHNYEEITVDRSSDRKGESRPLLSKVVGGATAAYSLRDLNDKAGNNKVVRVRRASDNNERDFLAKEVSNDTLQNWVNAPVVLPLDLQAKTADGRTGSVIPAKAAYSLRNLSKNYTGNVVDVRRSSDDTVQGFTADEIADGTLLSFVGSGNDGHVSKWYDQSGNTNHAVQATPASQPKIVNAGSLVADGGISGLDFDGDDFLVAPSVSGLESPFSMFSMSIRDTTGYTGSFSKSTAANRYFGSQEASTASIAAPRNSTSGVSVSASVSGSERLTFAVTTGETSTSVGSNGGTLANTTDDYGNDFRLADGINQLAIGVLRTVNPTGHFDGRIREVIFYTSDQTDNRTAIEANIGEAYNLDLPSGVDTGFDQVDGFVETWYDQSGYGHNATQLTAANQPKIVDGGVLVTDRDGKVALNGKGAKLDMPVGVPMLSSDGTYSLFAVVDFDDQRNGNDNFNNILRFDSTTAGGAASARKPLVYLDQNTGALSSTSPSFNSGSVNYTLAETLSVQLFTNIANPALSTGNNTAYADGVLVGSANDATGVNTNTSLSTSSQIFDNEETTVTHFLSEVIYYPSDQTANRPAIEANIKNQYEIS